MATALVGAHLALSFLVTYLAHSTLLLGGAWLLAKALRRQALPLQDLAWKLALVGGLVTATLRVVSQALERPAALVLEPWAVGHQPAAANFAAPHPDLVSFAGQLAGWERLVLVGWAVGAALGLLVLARSWQRLQQCLASRQALDSGPVRESLDELLTLVERPEPVRLSDAPALAVPVALGVLSPEICLPTRVVEELSGEARVAVLAHELAHLVRRDPAWLLVARVIESVFFVQPLNRMARIRLQVLSEYLADAWALEATGDRRGLASCLVEVAGWLRPTAALLAPGMAGSRGQLTARVERILDPRSTESRTVRLGAKLAFGAALALIAVFAPGLAPPPLLDPAPAVATTEAAPTKDVRTKAAPVVTRRSSVIAESVSDGVDGGIAEGITGGVDGEISAAAHAEADGFDLDQLQAVLAEVEPLALAELDALEQLSEAEALALAGSELERSRPSAEELEHLKAEALALAESHRPTQQQLEKLRAEARAMADRQRPSREELERLQEQARALVERSRRDGLRDLERLRNLDRLRVVLRTQNRGHLLREEAATRLDRSLAEQERQLEAALVRLRELRARTRRDHQRERAEAPERPEAPEAPEPPENN